MLVITVIVIVIIIGVQEYRDAAWLVSDRGRKREEETAAPNTNDQRDQDFPPVNPQQTVAHPAAPTTATATPAAPGTEQQQQQQQKQQQQQQQQQ